jgi:hypothetical protein
MVIETPKEKDAVRPGEVDPMDAMNLATLRALLNRQTPALRT